MERENRGRRGLMLAVLGLVLVGAVWAYSTGALEALSDQERIQTLVQEAGPFGPLLFITMSMALFAVFLMGPPVWASVLLWPWPLALLYSYTAGVLGSLAAYAIARASNADKLRIPERLEKYSAGLTTRPITTGIVVRLLLWANPAADVLAVVAGVPLRPYLIGTLIGLLPPTIFHVFLGTGLQKLGSLPMEGWVLLGVTAASGAGWLLWRRSRALANH